VLTLSPTLNLNPTQGLKVAVVEGHDIGGTCVNRGCVPSKALLAASGRVRELRDKMHLSSLGIQVRRARCTQTVPCASVKVYNQDSAAMPGVHPATLCCAVVPISVPS